jgi:putative (di)nucleoside polyphosphate hydrolase
MSGAAEEGAAPGYRRGVGIMLLDPRRRVFVGRRLDMAGEHWQMPQGGIDQGEAPLAAALRELHEEAGTDKAELIAESRRWYHYDVPEAIASRLWRRRYRGQTQKWFVLRFTGEDRDIDVATAHPEFGAWKWIPPSDLPRLIVPFKRQLYLDLLAEFAPVLGQ